MSSSKSVLPNRIRLVNQMRTQFNTRAVVLHRIPSTTSPKVVLAKFGRFLAEVLYSDGCFWAKVRPGVTTAAALGFLSSFEKDPVMPVSARVAPDEHTLFIGNLAPGFGDEDLVKLCKPHGTIVRTFVVRNESTGKSKGYGFAEYLTPAAATAAKSTLASKQLGGRAIRVDWAKGTLVNIDAVHSRTLFVDRLPRSFMASEQLKAACEVSGTALDFCQVAYSSGRSSSGKCRGFALVDYVTSRDAEVAQRAINELELMPGVVLRAAFGNPAKLGKTIFGQKVMAQAGKASTKMKPPPMLPVPIVDANMVLGGAPASFPSSQQQQRPRGALAAQHVHQQMQMPPPHMMMPNAQFGAPPPPPHQHHHHHHPQQRHGGGAQQLQRHPVTRLQHRVMFQQQNQHQHQHQHQHPPPGMQHQLPQQGLQQQMPQMPQQQMPGHKYQTRQGPALVLGQDPAPKCFSSPFRGNSFAPAPAMAAPPIRQHRRAGQQVTMPNMIVPTPASEQQQNIDPATKAARPVKSAPKPAFGRPAAGRSPLRLRNMAVGASRGNEMVPTMVTSPKSMFATGPAQQSRKRRMKPDFIEAKRQYSEQHDQGIDFMAGFVMSAPAERSIAVPCRVKRRRSNLNLAIPA